MIKGMIFSPFLKEIMAVPKDDLALSISKNIFDSCGNELEVSEQELNNYLVNLANREPAQPQPFKPFGIG